MCRKSKLFSNKVVTWLVKLSIVLLPTNLLELRSSGSSAQRWSLPEAVLSSALQTPISRPCGPCATRRQSSRKAMACVQPLLLPYMSHSPSTALCPKVLRCAGAHDRPVLPLSNGTARIVAQSHTKRSISLFYMC